MRRLRNLLVPVGLAVAGLAIVTLMPATEAAFSNTTANPASNFAAVATFPHALFLHNDPSPPVGDTTSQLRLPLDSTAPTGTILRNYDSERDAAPGLVVYKGNDGLAEANPTKFQRWRHVTASAFTIDGDVTLHLWTAMQDFDPAKRGAIIIGLLDCDSGGASCSLIASTTFTETPWPSSWEERSIDLGTLSYVVSAGRALVIHVGTDSLSDDDLWFAYDTNSFDSRLEFS
jgi:hypothetical protein